MYLPLPGHWEGWMQALFSNTIPEGQKQPATQTSGHTMFLSLFSQVIGHMVPHSVYCLPLVQVGAALNKMVIIMWDGMYM